MTEPTEVDIAEVIVSRRQRMAPLAPPAQLWRIVLADANALGRRETAVAVACYERLFQSVRRLDH